MMDDTRLPLGMKTLGELFYLLSGDFHAIKDLDPGETPLISCGDTDNGLVGYYETAEEQIYQHTLTVAYNGQPLTAKMHLYGFGAKDDVAVLIPREAMHCPTLVFVCAALNSMRWRYSYGRKCFRAKLHRLRIYLPLTEGGDVDEEAIRLIVTKARYWPEIEKRFDGTFIEAKRQEIEKALAKEARKKQAKHPPLIEEPELELELA